jgi:hypothetical protein
MEAHEDAAAAAPAAVDTAAAVHSSLLHKNVMQLS